MLNFSIDPNRKLVPTGKFSEGVGEYAAKLFDVVTMPADDNSNRSNL
jgi:hypothetical protein